MFPAISLRSAHLEEGTVLSLARGAVEDGYWLTPHHYSHRFPERPVLLSWIAAGLGSVTGRVTLWELRIPHVLALLAGALMVWRLVRTQASPTAALFAVLCFFGCPMIAQKVITAEPDVLVSVLLFAAFVLWWTGWAAGSVSWRRSLAIGIVLGAAALTKGVQPIAYFSLGVGAFLLWRQQWREFGPFLLANTVGAAIGVGWYLAVYQPGDLSIWIGHSRIGVDRGRTFYDFGISILAEWFPLSLLLPFAIYRLIRSPPGRAADLLLAVTLYATACTSVLAVWPDSATRYAMQATLALATMAGLMFDEWKLTRPALTSTILALVVAIASYPVILSQLIMPLAPDLFQASRLTASKIDYAMQTLPGTLYTTREAVSNNVLAQVRGKIREVKLQEFNSVPLPFLAVIRTQDVAQLTELLPDSQVAVWATLGDGAQSLVQARPPPGSSQPTLSGTPLLHPPRP